MARLAQRILMEQFSGKELIDALKEDINKLTSRLAG
jgi:hypothetical protein